MRRPSLSSRLLAGVGGGLAATAGMYGMRTATGNWLPEATPPMRQDPGEFMVEQAESVLPARKRQRVPERAEAAASSALHFGYGTTAALLYAALAGERPNVLRDGLLLGIGVWAAGYLGWLPRTGLMPPITQQRKAQVVVPLLQHAAFGVVAVVVYDWLQRRLGRRAAPRSRRRRPPWPSPRA
jgi:hypothetical protein